jgi:hypothetical protein
MSEHTLTGVHISSVADSEFFSSGPDPAFQVILDLDPDPDSTLKPDQVRN